MKRNKTTKQNAKTNDDTKTKLAAATAKLDKAEDEVRNALRDAFGETQRTAENFAELSGLLEEYSRQTDWDDMLFPWDSLSEIGRNAQDAIQMCHDLLKPLEKLAVMQKRVKALRKAQKKSQTVVTTRTNG